MSQVSRPFQLILVASLVFAGVWWFALRHHQQSESASSSPAPASQPAKPGPKPAPAHSANPPKSAIPGGLGRALDKAHAAVNTNNAAVATHESAAKAADTQGSAPTPAAVRTSASVPTYGPVARAGRSLAAGRVVALLFWDRASSDDRAVRSELRQVSGRKLTVIASPLKGLARFGPLTGNIQISDSPAVVVVGPHRHIQLLTGYVDATVIEQAIASVRRG